MKFFSRDVLQCKRVVTIFSIVALLSTSGCTYQDRVAPLALPDERTGVVLGEGLKISARAFTEEEEAQKAFGFNARKAGVLPVQVTFVNDSPETVSVNPEQTFLIDRNNNAWPILTLEKTYERTKGLVDVGETAKGTAKPALLLGAAGAVAGLAVGIVTGENIGESMGKGATIGAASGAVLGGGQAYAKTGERIREDLATKTLRNHDILPNQIAYGVLFFPGTPGVEAEGAAEVRLSLNIDGRIKIVKLDLRQP